MSSNNFLDQEAFSKKSKELELKALLHQTQERFDAEKDMNEEIVSNRLKLEEKIKQEVPEKKYPLDEQKKLSEEMKEYQDEIKKAKEEFKELKEDPTLEVMIKECKEMRKEAEKKLFIKRKELEIMSRMDTKTVNKLLLTNDFSLVAYYKESSEALKKKEELDEKEKLMDLKEINVYEELLKRTATTASKENYAKEKKEFYKPITEKEVKELHEEIRKNKENINKSKTVEDYEKLGDLYFKEYSRFLHKQPEIEKKREEIINNMAAAHDMMSALKNTPTFNAPKIWNTNKPTEKQLEEIKNYIARKELLFKNNWKIDIEKPFSRDILKEVDEYLDEKLAQASIDPKEKLKEKPEELDILEIEKLEKYEKDKFEKYEKRDMQGKHENNEGFEKPEKIQKNEKSEKHKKNEKSHKSEKHPHPVINLKNLE